MGRSPCCDENGLKKGPWTPEEDQKLVLYIQKHGHGSWRALPKLADLNRCGKSCRLRWTNYLRPDIKRGKFSQEEEQTILNLHSFLGNKWSAIATHLPGRTDNEIKNFWNTNLKKKLIHMGFDPMTHRRRTDLFSNLSHLIALANLKDFIDHHPWEDHTIRLQRESLQLARLQYLQGLLQSTTSVGTSSNTLTSITDIEGFDLMNSISSIKENPISIPTPSSSPGIDITQAVENSISFSHLPNLQVPCSFQRSLNSEMVQGCNFTVFSQGETTPTSPWINPSSPSPPITTAHPISITSTYGGGVPTFWPELLLEDPFIHEIA